MVTGHAREAVEALVQVFPVTMVHNPDLVYVHETGNTRFVPDLDTLDDVRRLAQRTGWQLEPLEVPATV